MRQFRVFTDLAIARTAYSMSVHVIAAVHMSASITSWYGNLEISSFSSGICGSFAFESVGTPEEAGILLASSTSNFSTIDLTYKC